MQYNSQIRVSLMINCKPSLEPIRCFVFIKNINVFLMFEKS